MGFAQTAEQTAEITKILSPHSQQIVKQLTGLNSLPDGEWRTHPGDLPHGENTTLDDSSWEVIKPGTKKFGDTTWYRRWIEVPKNLRGYDLAGTRIWFDFQAYGNGPLPEIIYFNGRRVALGDDLEPIVLFDQAKPGDRVLVAVKLLRTSEQREFGGAELKIDFAEHRPNPEDLREEMLSACILVPSLSTQVSADQATLELAISAVDSAALNTADQGKFDASLTTAKSMLEPLKPLLRQATYHEDGNSHIDAAWLWPVSETQDVVRRTFNTALQLMNEYPQYIYTQSAGAYNDWLAEKYPSLNDSIKRRVAEGRWEIVGGMWVEPDLNMPDGESQARSLLLGKRFFQKQYGVDVRIGWNPDSFGYNWQTPQIYQKSGIDYFVTQKMAWNDTNKLPFKLFWWQSPDGSKVLTYFPHDYANDNINPVRLAADLAEARKASPGLTDMLDLYGVGDHGGGPTRSVLDEGMHWQSPDHIIPTLEFGTAQSFFTKISGKLATSSPVWDYDSIARGYTAPTQPPPGQVAIPTWRSELYLEFHRGVTTTQANHKAGMRHSEEQVLNAERYASLAWLNGDAYPADRLNQAWQKVTFNDFHDLAAGSGIGVIYKDAQRDFDQVRLSSEEISGRALETISKHIDTVKGEGVPVLVFNPLAWERSGLVEIEVQMPAATKAVLVTDPHGVQVPVETVSLDKATNTFHLLVQVSHLPSLGYQILHITPGAATFHTSLKASGLTIENAAVRVTVDKTTGCITSLFDKKSNFESLAAGACGNDLEFFKDTPKEYDAWNIDPGTLDQSPSRSAQAEQVELAEVSGLRMAIRVRRKWQNSTFDQQIVLNNDDDQVSIVNDIDWHEAHVLVKAAFPLAASSTKATYEIPFGSIERPTTRNNRWDKAQFEVPALRWADLGDSNHGLSLINESKYGYDAVGNVLRLTLLRSPTSPDPDADRGHHTFSFALFPHAGSWKNALTVRHGYEYNYKPVVLVLAPHVGTLPPEDSFVSVRPQNVVLTALKKAEDSNSLIVHLYEFAGQSSIVELNIPAGATGVVETNLLEIAQPSRVSLAGEKISIPIKPYEIIALRIDYSHNK
ncbi:MAG: alpha-mannosidase [Terriglobales bacterium]